VADEVRGLGNANVDTSKGWIREVESEVLLDERRRMFVWWCAIRGGRGWRESGGMGVVRFRLTAI
jgi:hypothetical protein